VSVFFKSVGVIGVSASAESKMVSFLNSFDVAEELFKLTFKFPYVISPPHREKKSALINQIRIWGIA
jgi:hypothetical protein